MQVKAAFETFFDGFIEYMDRVVFYGNVPLFEMCGRSHENRKGSIFVLSFEYRFSG